MKLGGLVRFPVAFTRLLQEKVGERARRRGDLNLSESLASRGKFIAIIRDQSAAPVLKYDVDRRSLQLPVGVPTKYKIISIHVVVDQLDRRETRLAEAANCSCEAFPIVRVHCNVQVGRKHVRQILPGMQHAIASS